jgi:hypothetical protein
MLDNNCCVFKNGMNFKLNQDMEHCMNLYSNNLDRLLCKLPTDALITILSGDFNVNVKKRDKQSDSLLKLIQDHGFLPTHNNVTSTSTKTSSTIHSFQQYHCIIQIIFVTTLSIPYELLL